ncbi:MAG: alpha-ketoglutarate-dependent 2,4-dichlorophenoxyacetate dioxygenase [Polaribacter sp.]
MSLKLSYQTIVQGEIKLTEFNVEPLHAEFGARLSGLDLSVDLSELQLSEIHDAIDTYSFLCFPDQAISDDNQLALTRRLGVAEAEHVTFGKTGRTTYFGSVGNIDDAGIQQGNQHRDTRYQSGNHLWHSDSSFRHQPSYVSIMYPYEVPGEGGATEFVSQRAAYQRLGNAEKSAYQEMAVIHDYVFSRTQTAPVDFCHAASLPPVKHPLVRTNPANQLKNLYIGSHARSIVGLDGIESRRVIDQLLIDTTRPQDILSHIWRVGEVVIWDNRCVLHRGTGYDADRWRRHMRQTRVVGEHKGIL